jgi:hypothetical protein
MSQYAWKGVFKFIPTDGIEETMDLASVFTDTSGPGKIDPSHVYESTNRQDVNRRGNQKDWGFRPRCKMTFEIIDTALQAYFALIVNRLRATDVWVVLLSLDGGINYRQVQLKSFDGPDPIQGKTFAGAKYVLEVEGVELLDQIPNLGSGVW